MSVNDRLAYLRMMKNIANVHSTLDEELSKAFNKEEVMNKFLVITESGNAKYAKDMTEAKKQSTEAVLAGYDKVFVYELKAIVMERKSIDFKEV